MVYRYFNGTKFVEVVAEGVVVDKCPVEGAVCYAFGQYTVDGCTKVVVYTKNKRLFITSSNPDIVGKKVVLYRVTKMRKSLKFINPVWVSPYEHFHGVVDKIGTKRYSPCSSATGIAI